MTNIFDVNEWVEFFQNSFTQLGQQIVSFFPHLLAAVLIFIVGWIVSRMVRGACRHLFQVIGLDNLAEKARISELLQKAKVKEPFSALLAQVIYWILLLVFIVSALEALQLSEVSQALGEFVDFIPNLFTALLILLFGTLLAKFCSDIVQATTASAELKHGPSIARVAYAFVLVFMIVIALDKVGIETSLFTANITVIIAGIVGMGVLAVGLGGKSVAGNILAQNYIRGLVSIGDEISVNGVKGKVEKMTSTTVVLQTKDGTVLVPNKAFMEHCVSK